MKILTIVLLIALLTLTRAINEDPSFEQPRSSRVKRYWGGIWWGGGWGGGWRPGWGWGGGWRPGWGGAWGGGWRPYGR